MKEITLPAHEAATGIRRCHDCHGTMHPHTYSYTYHPKGANEEITVHNIHGYKCDTCGEVVCSTPEAKRIEEVLRPYLNKWDNF